VLLALRAVEHGLPELAGQFLEKALELGDKSDIAYAICGATKYITKTEAAAGLLDVALRIDPHDERTANAIAGIFYPTIGGYFRLAERAAADGFLDLAERCLEKALEIARDKKAAKKWVNVFKEMHGLRRPRTGWF